MQIYRNYKIPIIHLLLVICHIIIWNILSNTPLIQTSIHLKGYAILALVYFIIYFDFNRSSNRNIIRLKKYYSYIIFFNLTTHISFMYIPNLLPTYIYATLPILTCIVLLSIFFLRINVIISNSQFSKKSTLKIWYILTKTKELNYYRYYLKNMHPLTENEVIRVINKLHFLDLEDLKILKYYLTTPAHFSFIIVNILNLFRLFLWIGSIGIIANFIQLTELKNIDFTDITSKFSTVFICIFSVIILVVISITFLYLQRKNQVATLLPILIDDAIEEKKEEDNLKIQQ